MMRQTWCPTCDGKRTDAAAIKAHNLLASQSGCRAYPVSWQPKRVRLNA
jgi:hypothetical protein